MVGGELRKDNVPVVAFRFALAICRCLSLPNSPCHVFTFGEMQSMSHASTIASSSHASTIASSSCASFPTDLFADATSAVADFNTFRLECAKDEEAYSQRFLQQQKFPLPEGRPLSQRGAYSARLDCMRPESGSWKMRHEPLRQPLVPGRVCASDLCAADNCALHVRDEVVVPDEAALLVAHGKAVLASEDAGSSFGDLAYKRSRRIDFMQSAVHGSLAGHLLCLRLAERLRRIVAEIFGLPRARVRVSEHFLTLRQPGPSLEQAVHCDEAVFPDGEGAKARWRFHFSSVLWLGDAGDDFDGGALAFYYNHTRPWLEVEPAVGRAAFFSSGWENVHGIRPVSRGHRWALTAAFMVHEEMGARPNPARDFREQCVHPTGKHAYASCRQHWAATMLHDTGTAGGGGALSTTRTREERPRERHHERHAAAAVEGAGS